MVDVSIQSVQSQPESREPGNEAWRALLQNRFAMASLAFIVILVLVAVFAPFLAPHDPTVIDKEHLLAPPAWQKGGSWVYPLGTDPLGRCMLSRLLYGARLSLLVGVIVVTISLLAGVGLGLFAAFSRSWSDGLIMRSMDVILALPGLLLAMVIVVILGPGLLNAIIAVAITNIPYYARLTRAAALLELTKDYVTAARVSGVRTPRLMFRTVLPNCLAPLIVQTTLGISSAIIDAASLGFLGLGAQPPIPEWGTMLADSRGFIQRAPWVVTLPGIAILLTVLAFNLLGDGLRDALDPRLKKS